MRSQFRFAMHPDDERLFEEELLREESVRFIAGPRWPQETPETSRSLATLEGAYCIIWSPEDLPRLQAKFIPECSDWYCRSEHATVQFIRCRFRGDVLVEGRIAVATISGDNGSAKRVEARYRRLRSFLRNSYRNRIVQWHNPTLPSVAAAPGRSANPSSPDDQMWVGPAALQWLLEDGGRRIQPAGGGRACGILVQGTTP